MSDTYETLNIGRSGPYISVVTLNRPDAANALNMRMGQELMAFFADIPADTRVVVVAGEGEKAFCAGADLKERLGMTDEQWHDQHHSFEAMIQAVPGCPVPVIAAVNGAAFGGGFELALACDFIYASDSAKFGLPEVRLGIMPGLGGTQTLARVAGEARAKEMIFSGRSYTAAEAYEWNIVNKVCSYDSLMAEVLEIAEAISANAPLSVRYAKQAMHQGLQMNLHEGMQFELKTYARLIPTQDRKEGVAAFNEKRAPVFKGQ